MLLLETSTSSFLVEPHHEIVKDFWMVGSKGRYSCTLGSERNERLLIEPTTGNDNFVMDINFIERVCSLS